MSETVSKPEPETYAEVLIPDAIEPLYGWKALEITHDGRLCSPQQRQTVWPVKKRLEAVCHNTARQSSYEWKAIRGTKGNPAPPQVTAPPSGTIVTSAAMTISSTVTVSGGNWHVEPPEPPALVLPQGMVWSWEEVPHEIASNNCRCGIYVVNDPRQCQSYLNQNCLLAEICLWGRVVPGSEGARGEFAYPRQLFAPDTLTDVATMVAQLYGVPIGYRDHQTGATITHTQAMENLARIKAGLRAKPFQQKGPPTTIPPVKLQPVAQIPPPPLPKVVKPPAVMFSTSNDTKPVRPLSTQEREARVVFVLCWIGVLVMWALSLALSPWLLVGVLPFFAVIRSVMHDLPRKSN